MQKAKSTQQKAITSKKKISATNKKFVDRIFDAVMKKNGDAIRKLGTT